MAPPPAPLAAPAEAAAQQAQSAEALDSSLQPSDQSIRKTTHLQPEDFYLEGPYTVFTAAYHLKRGTCCNSNCRHCPYHNSA
jgi:hypothetical protein